MLKTPTYSRFYLSTFSPFDKIHDYHCNNDQNKKKVLNRKSNAQAWTVSTRAEYGAASMPTYFWRVWTKSLFDF